MYLSDEDARLILVAISEAVWCDTLSQEEMKNLEDLKERLKWEYGDGNN